PLPDNLGTLDKLQTLNLAGNLFTGPIPGKWATGLGALTSLNLAGNCISGSLPAPLSNKFTLGPQTNCPASTSQTSAQTSLDTTDNPATNPPTQASQSQQQSSTTIISTDSNGRTVSSVVTTIAFTASESNNGGPNSTSSSTTGTLSPQNNNNSSAGGLGGVPMGAVVAGVLAPVLIIAGFVVYLTYKARLKKRAKAKEDEKKVPETFSQPDDTTFDDPPFLEPTLEDFDVNLQAGEMETDFSQTTVVQFRNNPLSGKQRNPSSKFQNVLDQFAESDNKRSLEKASSTAILADALRNGGLEESQEALVTAPFLFITTNEKESKDRKDARDFVGMENATRYPDDDNYAGLIGGNPGGDGNRSTTPHSNSNSNMLDSTTTTGNGNRVETGGGGNEASERITAPVPVPVRNLDSIMVVDHDAVEDEIPAYDVGNYNRELSVNGGGGGDNNIQQHQQSTTTRTIASDAVSVQSHTRSNVTGPRSIYAQSLHESANIFSDDNAVARTSSTPPPPVPTLRTITPDPTSASTPQPQPADLPQGVTPFTMSVADRAQINMLVRQIAINPPEISLSTPVDLEVALQKILGPYYQWTPNQVVHWANQRRFKPAILELFRSNFMDGALLHALDANALTNEFGITTTEGRRDVMFAVDLLKRGYESIAAANAELEALNSLPPAYEGKLLDGVLLHALDANALTNEFGITTSEGRRDIMFAVDLLKHCYESIVAANAELEALNSLPPAYEG
ncbi:hypothetical protein HDU76_007164, partial [Blyttiomyces sp. JEL0837]